jgi:hypothetical protein
MQAEIQFVYVEIGGGGGGGGKATTTRPIKLADNHAGSCTPEVKGMQARDN